MRSGEWDSDELARANMLARRARGVLNGDARLWAVRAPGRVNLIGEHTDYSGLPVLPVAIDRCTIIVAAAREDAAIEVHNADPAYPARSFALTQPIAPFDRGDWGNYVKAAVQGVIGHFIPRGLEAGKFSGCLMMVDGRVPPAAGLSSSAALTVASALAFMTINGLDLPMIETAQMVARSEWYVGTMAGGMDQTAALMGQRDHALFIQFNPLRVRPIKMPPQAALVVANSGEVADKSGRVRAEYNRRVVECRLAARIIARALKLEGIKVLGDILGRLGNWSPEQLVAMLGAAAPQRVDSASEAAQLLGIEAALLSAELFGEANQGVSLDETFPLEILRRTRHVLSETRRVENAVAALETGNLEAMGALMNESHQSLADDFEVSTPGLDRLVQCARRGGALGARLTGAGFGGSIVALCHSSQSAEVIAALDRDFYSQLPGANAAFEMSRTILHAGDGAGVIELN